MEMNSGEAIGRSGDDVPQELLGTRAALFFLWNNNSVIRTTPRQDTLPPEAAPITVQAGFGRTVRARVNVRPYQDEPIRPSSADRDDFVFG